jgi:hypothetical protein
VSWRPWCGASALLLLLLLLLLLPVQQGSTAVASSRHSVAHNAPLLQP